MVDREHGPAGRGLGEDSAQPVQLLGIEVAVAGAGDARIEHDHAGPTGERHDPVLARRGPLARGDSLAVDGGDVVVAHDDRERRVESGGEGVEDLVEQSVALGGAVLGRVTGVDHGVDVSEALESGQDPAQGRGGVDPVVVAGVPVAVEVRVGQVQDAHAGNGSGRR